MQRGDTLRIVFDYLVLQAVLFGQEIGFQEFQFLNLNIQVHLLFDIRIAGCEHFYLGVGQRRFVYIFCGTDRRFARHNLTCEFLLALHKLIQICVEGFFRNKTEHIDFGI